MNIKALAFHSSISETKSGDILFSIDNGIVSLYRIELSQSGEVLEQNVLQFQIYVNHDISAIEILRLTQSNGKHFVIAIFLTLSSLYCVTGPDDLELILVSYKNQSEKVKEMPMPKGYMCMMHTSYSKILKRATSIIWTNGNSILNIKIPDQDELINDSFLSRN